MPSLGHYKDIPMVPSLELDRRSSLSSVAKTRNKEAQEEKDDEMDLSGGQWRDEEEEEEEEEEKEEKEEKEKEIEVRRVSHMDVLTNSL